MTDDAAAPRWWRTIPTRTLIRLGAIVLVLALVVRAIDDKQLLLDYVRAMVWPFVVIGVLWWLREPLRAKLADLLEVTTSIASARFASQEAANRDLEGDIAEASDVLLGTIDGGRADSSFPDAEPELPLAPATKATTDAGPEVPAGNAEMNERMREGARRLAMERVIRESAGWGYDMATLGFKSRPVPEIIWDDQGRPQILYARGQTEEEEREQYLSPILRARPVTEQVRRLEEEIRQLERQRDDPRRLATLDAPSYLTFDHQLRRLRTQLSILDPNSPYAT